MITQVNLPASQLLVACGVPLYRIPEIRRMYGESVTEETPIDFDNRRGPILQCLVYDLTLFIVVPNGHVIACRITAENPDAGFTPTSGKFLLCTGAVSKPLFF
jgi:acetyl-CoA carboxylase/biotin carboxylase 1